MVDKLKFNMACLNCLTKDPDLEYHFFDWENFEDEVKKENQHPATWNFYATKLLKKEFFIRKRPCEYCGYSGAFDIYNLLVNEKSLYVSPEDHLPRLTIDYLKQQGEIGGNYRLTANLPTANGMIEVAKAALDNPPQSLFIPKEKGYFQMLLFQYDNDWIDVNSFKYAGFSYNEIDDIFKVISEKIAENIKGNLI